MRPIDLRAMSEAPTARASWVTLWYEDGLNTYPVAAHWAGDLSGEEQPPFEGWFRWSGCRGGGHYPAPDNPIGWTPIEQQTDLVATLQAENKRLSEAVCSGVLRDLLKPDEAAALADFIKSLRRPRTSIESGEKG